MSKQEGSKTVVVGGQKSVQQQYCGTVGGQSSDYSTMDNDIKVRSYSCSWLRALINASSFNNRA